MWKNFYKIDENITHICFQFNNNHLWDPARHYIHGDHNHINNLDFFCFKSYNQKVLSLPADNNKFGSFYENFTEKIML